MTGFGPYSGRAYEPSSYLAGQCSLRASAYEPHSYLAGQCALRASAYEPHSYLTRMAAPPAESPESKARRNRGVRFGATGASTCVARAPILRPLRAGLTLWAAARPRQPGYPRLSRFPSAGHACRPRPVHRGAVAAGPTLRLQRPVVGVRPELRNAVRVELD